MSTDFLFLKSIINSADKTDDLLEQNIKENEARIKALENLNNIENTSNFMQNDESQIKELKNLTNINYIQKEIFKDKSLNKFDNSNEVYHFDEINLSITPLKKEKILENNNNSSSYKIGDISTNFSKNKINNNKSINIKVCSNNNIRLISSINNKENNKDNFKKNNIYCHITERRRNSKKNVSNFNNNNSFKSLNEYRHLYDITDSSIYFQYITFLSNQKIRNKSEEKRYLHKMNKYNPINNEDKFSNIYNRFIEKDKKIKDKINIMKKNREEQENKKYLYKPEINKKSKILASIIKEDFFTRQDKLIEKKKKNESLLRDKNKNKEKEKNINKSDIKFSLNLSVIHGNKKNRKRSVDETINKLYEWEIKRKEKINKKIKYKENSIENNIQQKPKINKKSYKIANKNNSKKVIDRLYIYDIEKRKENKIILSQIYMPKFQPFLIKKSPSKINSHNIINNNTIQSKNNINTNLNSENFSCNYLINNNIMENINEENGYDINIDQLFRNKVLRKMKNRIRYRSAVKFNVLTGGNNNCYIYNNNKSNNKDNNNKVEKSSNKYVSNSYVKRTIKRIHYF